MTYERLPIGSLLPGGIEYVIQSYHNMQGGGIMRWVRRVGLMVMCVILSTYGLVYTQEPPEVKSMTPTSGADYGGTRVRIKGSHFQIGATVTFGGVPATEVSRSSSSYVYVE